MKITTKILCQRVKGPLSQALYLDISGLGIGAVDGLECCPRLQILDLSKNCLDELENFECCKHLWRINLSNNKLKCLDNLSKMQAIGTLDLSNNQLTWSDLIHIRHVHILDLRLHGNETLENDIYYRLHVIDCLPLVWMLDGRLITSAERLQVQQFFYDSALSSRPVRHKMNENSYMCTKVSKSVQIHGDRTCQFSTCFPTHEPHNRDTDKRRLEFLASNLEEDLKNRAQSIKQPFNIISQNCLTHLLKNREDEKEKCNMLLLLLISSLEFNLPGSLIEQTLEVTKLNPLFGKDTLQLFHLDASSCTEVISLFVSSCKLDRDVTKPSAGNFSSGGLYDRLYLCLYHSVERLVKKACHVKRLKTDPFTAWNDRRQNGRNVAHVRPQTAPPNRKQNGNLSRKVASEWKAHQGLLASELVLLLSVVPSFYHHISEKNESVCHVLSLATGDHDLYLRLSKLAHELTLHGGDINSLYKEICKSVINRIEMAAMNTPVSQDAVTITENNASILRISERISSNTKQARFILNTSSAYPRRPKSATLTSSERLSEGKCASETTSYIHMTRPYELPHLTLGSLVLLAPQNLAKVIALPEQHIALVQMDLITRSNGSVSVQAKNMEDHFCYIDVRKLVYDYQAGYWKPRGAVGDKITLQAEDVTWPDATPPIPEYAEIERALSSTKIEKNLTRVKEQPVSHREWSSARSSDGATSTALMLVPKDAEKLHGPSHLKIDQPSTMRPLSALFCKKMDLSLAESTLQYKGLPQSRDQHDVSGEHADDRDLGISDTFLTAMDHIGISLNENELENDVDERVTDMKYKTEYEPDFGQYIDGEDWGYTVPEENPVDTFLQNRVNPEERYSEDSSLVGSPSSKGTPELQRRSTMQEDSVVPDSEQENKSSRPPVNISVPRSSFDAGIKLGDKEDMEDNNQSPHISMTNNSVDPGMNVGDQEDAEDNNKSPNIPMPSSRVDPGMKIGDQEDAEDGYQSPNNSVDEHELRVLADDDSLSGMDDKLAADFEGTLLDDFVDEIDRNTTGLSLSGSQVLFHKPRVSSQKQRAQSAKVPKHKNTASKQKAQRPVSAILLQQKRVMFHEDHEISRPGSASSFQLRRTEAWRSSTSSGGFVEGVQGKVVISFDELTVDRTAFRKDSKVKFSMGMRRPPPQRPTSPDQVPHSLSSQSNSIHPDYLQVVPSQISIRSEEDRQPKPRKVQTSRWLAEGRNVHKEDFDHRRTITSPRLPGYMEGLSLQPTRQSVYGSTPNTDTAIHVLPSRFTKPFATFPRTSYGRKYENSPSSSSLMTGAPFWHRPRFSSLSEVKKLSAKPMVRSRRSTFMRR